MVGPICAAIVSVKACNGFTLPGKFSRCPGSNEMREGDTTLRPIKTNTVLFNNKYYMNMDGKVKNGF